MSGYDFAVKNKLALVLPPTLDKIQSDKSVWSVSH